MERSDISSEGESHHETRTSFRAGRRLADPRRRDADQRGRQRAADAPCGLGTGPYIHMAGGMVKFARRPTMAPIDLTTVPKTRPGALGLSHAAYCRQSLADYSTSQTDGGLVGYVADFRSLGRR